MPALSADWEAVKATAIACGNLKEAAEAHGISHESVRMRASREQWPVGRRVHIQAQQARQTAQQQLVKASGGAVTSVTSAADALQNVMADHSKKAKIALARAGRAAAEHFSAMDGQEIAIEAQNFKHIVAANDQIHGWNGKTAANGAGILVNVQLLSMLSHDVSPAIDVTAEVTALDTHSTVQDDEDMAGNGQIQGEE